MRRFRNRTIGRPILAAIRPAVRAFIESGSQFEVCKAVYGTEAFDKAVLLRPDLIVLDLSMPNLNGVEVAISSPRHATGHPGCPLYNV